MKNIFACLLLGLLWGICSVPAYAQAGFKPGYVVKPAGDTLQGYIQARGAVRSSLQCRFRTALDAAPVDFTSADLRTYAFADGARFEACMTPLLDSAGRRPERLFFLEVLVSGKATLYMRRDGYDETHYYLRMASANPGPLLELENRVHRAVNISEVNVSQPLYRKTLSEAFRDCFGIQPLLPTLGYSSVSLTSVVQRYNSYFAAPTAVHPRSTERQPSQQQMHFSGGIVGGLAKTEMRFSGPTSLHNGKFTTNASAVVGVFVTSALPALNKKLQLRLELLYEQLNYANSYTARDISTVEVREQASLQFQCLQVPLQLRYSFGPGPVQPFLLGGFTGGYLLSSTRQLRSEYTAGSSLVVNNYVPVDDASIRHFEVGLLGGAGIATSVKGHAVGLEVRAERSSGFVDSGSISAPIFRYSGLLSISLF